MSSTHYHTPPPTVPSTRRPSISHPLRSPNIVTNLTAPLSTTGRASSPTNADDHPGPHHVILHLPPPGSPFSLFSTAHTVPRAPPYPVPHPSNLQLCPSPLTKSFTFCAPLTPGSYAYPTLRYSHRPSIAAIHLHPGVKTNRDELDESPAPTSPNPRADKRRRTRKAAPTSNPDRPDSPSMGSIGVGESPGSIVGESNYPPPGQPQRRLSGLAPIKPIGFAASRENRRESGGAESGALPSPVVMGFDFQKVDEDQLKTASSGLFKKLALANCQVRDTIGIKAQQEALIAQRRRDIAASTPNTPKELTFKGWQPKEQDRAPSSAAPVSSGSGSVGRRRDKTRDKVERMSINTASGDKDGPGSKSAPMNPNLSGQQSERGDPQSGAPQGLHPNGHNDPRTAPMSNVRGSRADDGEFTRQQAVPTTGQYYRRYEPGHGHSHNRSVTDSGPRSSARIVTSSSRGYDDRMPPPTAGGGGGGSRNGYPGVGGHQGGHPGPGATYTSQEHGDSGSNSPSPPPPPPRQHPAAHGPPQMSARREAFLAPYNQMYDLLHQSEGLRYNLQDLLHRYEGLYAGQQVAMQEFKTTAASSNTLLGNLQQSAESLKEMVRYEVGRSIAANAPAGGSGEGNKKEVDELKERIKKLEEKLAEKKD